MSLKIISRAGHDDRVDMDSFVGERSFICNIFISSQLRRDSLVSLWRVQFSKQFISVHHHRDELGEKKKRFRNLISKAPVVVIFLPVLLGRSSGFHHLQHRRRARQRSELRYSDGQSSRDVWRGKFIKLIYYSGWRWWKRKNAQFTCLSSSQAASATVEKKSSQVFLSLCALLFLYWKKRRTGIILPFTEMFFLHFFFLLTIAKIFNGFFFLLRPVLPSLWI